MSGPQAARDPPTHRELLAEAAIQRRRRIAEQIDRSGRKQNHKRDRKKLDSCRSGKRKKSMVGIWPPAAILRQSPNAA
jgi:hypothetical protein